MSHVEMRHVAHTNEPCHHVEFQLYTHESRDISGWVVLHVRMSHAAKGKYFVLRKN